MPLEGDLVVRLAWDGQRVQRVAVRSSRPSAARTLIGMTPASAAATVPLLFSVCAGAQAAAAASALAAAGADPFDRLDAELRVALETVQEYLRRLLIDWPRAMDREPRTEAVAAARRQIAATLRGAQPGRADAPAPHAHELSASLGAIAAQSVYGMRPAKWLALNGAEALHDWTERHETLPAQLLGELLRETPRCACSDIALMPPVCPAALLGAVVPAMEREPAFARAPTWGGVPVETGALARMRAHPLVAALVRRCGHSVPVRMTARLVELATLIEELSAGETAPARVQGLALTPGEGLSAVQTARGLLLHRVRIADGHVADYQIVAPTEWNFHPQGALVRGLEGLVVQQAAALERQASLAVQALDPCVACRIEVGHA